MKHELCVAYLPGRICLAVSIHRIINRMIESSRLEKISKIIKFNCQRITTMSLLYTGMYVSLHAHTRGAFCTFLTIHLKGSVS